MPVNRPLPAEILFDCQNITLAGFLQAQQTASNSRNHFSFTPDDPSVTARRWQIRNRQGASVGTYDIVHAGTQLTVHTQLTPNTQVLTANQNREPDLKMD